MQKFSSKEFPFHSHFISVPVRNVKQMNMHYVLEGDQFAERTLLMVHGNPTWSFMYRQVIKRYENLPMKLLAVDHLGMGLSDSLHENDQAITFTERVEHLKFLLTRLQIKNVVLMAHDWGGAIGLKACLELHMMEKINFQLEGIFLMNTAAFFLNRLPLRISSCRWPVLGKFFAVNMNLFLQGALTFAAKTNLSKEVKRGFLFPYKKKAQRRSIHDFVMDIPMTENHPTRKPIDELQELIGKIQKSNPEIPLTIVWGMKDFCFTPAFLQKWRSLWPKASIFEQKQAGHLVLEDAWEEVAMICDKFLQKVISKQAEQQAKERGDYVHESTSRAQL